MAIFDIFRRKTPAPVAPKEDRSLPIGLGFNLFSSWQNDQAMKLSAVYASVNEIANSIAVMPLDIYKDEDGKRVKTNHPLYSILNGQVDIKLNRFQFMKQITKSVLLKGDGYALILRDERLNVIGLRYVDSDLVQPMLQPNGSVKYLVSGMEKAVDAQNMLHFFLHVDSTFRGISVIKYASDCLKSVGDAEQTAGNFFRSGGNLSGIIKASSPLNNDQKTQIKDNWSSAFNSNNERVSVAVLPAGLDYQPISVNPEDAQLLESRQWNIYEIARFFNIPVSKLGVYDKASYNSREQDQLIYLQDCILPIATAFEAEMNQKLFKPSQIGRMSISYDFGRLMSADKKTEAEYYHSLVTSGMMTINEARNKIGLPPVAAEDGGDTLWMQLSFGTVKDIAEGKYIKQNAKDQDKVDNNQKQNNEE